MGSTIGILEVDQKYRDEEAEEFADILDITNPQDVVGLFNMVKLIGTLYVREKYHRKKRDIPHDLLQVKAAKDSIEAAIRAVAEFSPGIQDDLNFLAALDRKYDANGAIHPENELIAQLDLVNIFGESVLKVPSSSKKSGKQALYSLNGIGEVLDTTINQHQRHIDQLKIIHRRHCELEQYLTTRLDGKSRSGPELFAINMLLELYEDYTGKKAGRSYRSEIHKPDGPVLQFVEKALIRLRPPKLEQKRLEYVLKKVLKNRKNTAN